MSERLYTDLAHWWPLIRPAESYVDQAELYSALLQQVTGGELTSLLELGSGCGLLATQLPGPEDLTLLDISYQMLEVSREHNPTATHVCTDMRTMQLGRIFDAILLHDAVMYVLSGEDLRAVFDRAFEHLRPGGAFLVCPDVVEEDFEEGTVSGGSWGPGRGAQLLEWHWDPDPTDSTFQVDMSFLLRDDDGKVTNVHDQHTMGLYPRALFWESLTAAGFEILFPDAIALPEGTLLGEVFLCRRPEA